ncbi:hypothetical protein Fmac_004630 [Flemingia macrophylla]|uniref:Uncharacterized protein n=1 Tax=Flemingia macrophylla TaxID=520843 RepID=A0ABD1N5L1_9FABA
MKQHVRIFYLKHLRLHWLFQGDNTNQSHNPLEIPSISSVSCSILFDQTNILSSYDHYKPQIYSHTHNVSIFLMQKQWQLTPYHV